MILRNISRLQGSVGKKMLCDPLKPPLPGLSQVSSFQECLGLVGFVFCLGIVLLSTTFVPILFPSHPSFSLFLYLL